MEKLPVLCIVPHGGVAVPEELVPYVLVDEFELFYASDSCANEIFDFGERAETISSDISRLFVDLDCSPTDMPGRGGPGVIKRLTPAGKEIFEPDSFPTPIALANLIRRYHYPFYSKIRNALKGDIALVIECHVTLGIGARNTPEADKPLPLVRIHRYVDRKGAPIESCPSSAAEFMMDLFVREFGRNRRPEDFVITSRPVTGYLSQNFFKHIPYLRIDISRSFFYDDRFFTPEKKTDRKVIARLRESVFSVIEKTYRKRIALK